ncbi:hypothetical protein JZ751_015457, partial [Albula glossodonta]
MIKFVIIFIIISIPWMELTPETLTRKNVQKNLSGSVNIKDVNGATRSIPRLQDSTSAPVYSKESTSTPVYSKKSTTAPHSLGSSSYHHIACKCGQRKEIPGQFI